MSRSDSEAAAEGAPTRPRASFVVRLLVIVFAVVAVLGLTAMIFDTFDRAAPPKFCTMEGMVTPDGRIYGRDPDQACKFVDEEGRVLPGQ